jgi:hypothetical protein
MKKHTDNSYSNSKKNQFCFKEITEHYFNFREYLDNEKQRKTHLIPTVSIIHRFFKDGKKFETEYLMDGKPDYKTVYGYNEEKQLIETTDILPSGIPRNKSIYRYDSNGLNKEIIVYSDMENVDFIIGYSYNEKLQRISESLSHSEPGEDVITFYEYSNNDREIISTSKDGFGKTIDKTIELIDDKGNLITCKGYNETEVLDQESWYEYDAWNNILKKGIKTYSDQDIVEQFQTKYEYLYDNENNWIRKIVFADDEEFSSVITREIVYY